MAFNSISQLQVPTAADLVIERLRAAIISGELRPGERLSESDIGQRMGLSRSPVREALRHLEQERLIVTGLNRRYYVWKPTPHDVDEIFSLRLMLETLAAELIIERLTEADFARLDAMIDTQRELVEAGTDILGITKADRHFHEYLCSRSGHSRLMQWWGQIMGQWEVLIYQIMIEEPGNSPRSMIRDHTEIVNGLRRHDLDAVLQLHRRINGDVIKGVKSWIQVRP